MGASPTPQQYAAAMELAAIAYEDEANLGAQRAAMEAAFVQLRETQPWETGPWTLAWGPATDQGILAYVAQVTGTSTYALVFRGSLADVDAHDFLRNWFEDANALHQVPFDYPASAGAQISSGANIAFGSIAGLVDPDSQQTLPAYIGGLAASEPITLIVAGHSLGGALVQIGSLWLRSQLATQAQRITFLPCTFAAPTFGNQQFATLFDATFPNSFRAVNTLDVVPMAYENISGVQSAYRPPGQTLSEFDLTLDGLAQIVKVSSGNVYRSVSGGTFFSFTGWMPPTAASWGQIAAANHASDTYLDFVRTHAIDEINQQS